MNDPGLDAPIGNGAKAVERQQAEDVEEEEEIEQEEAYLTPSRWWFASTAFPLVAATFGPMASAFNVCALAVHWRVSIPPGGTEEHGIDVPDPGWLLGVNGLSLVLALFANFALLLNMANRLSFTVAQPITIVGWFISCFLLVGLVIATTYDLPLPAGEDRALTQGFYYACMSAGLYFFISSLMMVTVYGAYKGHYPAEFKLTTSQRTLMLQYILLMIYLLGGAGVYARIEGWTFTDAVYWADFTLLTVGTGDYAPATHLGRGLLFPYAVFGIVILGLVIGSIRSLILERGKVKLGDRIVEKKRERIVRRLTEGDGKVKLTPLSKAKEVEIEENELNRRRQEFELMRKIQYKASTSRKWTSLAISLNAWFILWIIGALIFYKAERNQDWSYFQALYFAYVSLLTIGYGDFHPMSNFGRAFFVFWSLLAIPTLTILISNLGDTVIKSIRDLTIYFGEITVLPGDASVGTRIRYGAHKLTRGQVLSGKNIMEEPPGLLSDKDDAEGHRKPPGGEATDRLAEEYEKDELIDAEEAKKSGNMLDHDRHYYHYLLVREIRNVMKHLGESPPKRYNYEEWAWFLKLAGEDEASSQHHRQPPSKVEKGDTNEVQSAEADDGNNVTRQWSWLGNRSPLMGETDEAEWVMEKLSSTLERELKKTREVERQGRRRETPPPSRGSSKTLEGERSNESNGHSEKKGPKGNMSAIPP